MGPWGQRAPECDPRKVSDHVAPASQHPINQGPSQSLWVKAASVTNPEPRAERVSSFTLVASTSMDCSSPQDSSLHALCSLCTWHRLPTSFLHAPFLSLATGLSGVQTGSCYKISHNCPTVLPPGHRMQPLCQYWQSGVPGFLLWCSFLTPLTDPLGMKTHWIPWQTHWATKDFSWGPLLFLFCFVCLFKPSLVIVRWKHSDNFCLLIGVYT